jgi:antitoxin YefM
MTAITYTAARANLASVMDSVCSDKKPITVTRSGKDQAVVVLSLDEYERLTETNYLLRSPANTSRLMSSIKSLKSGKGKERKLVKDEQ